MLALLALRSVEALIYCAICRNLHILRMKYLSYLLWPAIISVPLYLTYLESNICAPFSLTGSSPCGLILGIVAVVVGQAFVLIYFHLYKRGYFGELICVQKKTTQKYDLWAATVTHLSQPEGFVMLGGYLIGTWMFGLMPTSYYSFTGGINWFHVALQLLIVDALQYIMHRLEHDFHRQLYIISHKPHHRYMNPKLFDAFDGSIGDTFLMILVPLFVTAHLIHANVWSYMTFGSLYANWLCLIHSEYLMPWDGVFRSLGFGTSSDHHVHHALHSYNYGHLFM